MEIKKDSLRSNLQTALNMNEFVHCPFILAGQISIRSKDHWYYLQVGYSGDSRQEQLAHILEESL